MTWSLKLNLYSSDFGITDAVICLAYNYSIIVKYMTNFFPVTTDVFASNPKVSIIASFADTLPVKRKVLYFTVGQAV